MLSQLVSRQRLPTAARIQLWCRPCQRQPRIPAPRCEGRLFLLLGLVGGGMDMPRRASSIFRKWETFAVRSWFAGKQDRLAVITYRWVDGFRLPQQHDADYPQVARATMIPSLCSSRAATLHPPHLHSSFLIFMRTERGGNVPGRSDMLTFFLPRHSIDLRQVLWET